MNVVKGPWPEADPNSTAKDRGNTKTPVVHNIMAAGFVVDQELRWSSIGEYEKNTIEHRLQTQALLGLAETVQEVYPQLMPPENSLSVEIVLSEAFLSVIRIKPVELSLPDDAAA
jgi:hypothetical protein